MTAVGTILLTMAIMLLALAGLATGLFLGRGPVRGSCGGLGCAADRACDACPRRGEER